MSGVTELQERVETLEQEIRRLERVNEALINRVERSTDEAGSSYSLFESNLLLQNKIKEHSGRLIHINRDLQREIRERKEVEEALRRERDFTSAILNTVGVLIVVLDRQGRIVRFNRACEKITGHAFEEVKHKYVWELFIIPEEVRLVKGIFKELQAGLFPNNAENYWVTKEGKRRLISWANTAILDHEGQVEHIIGTGVDITEHRQAEEALRESEERYRSIFENATMGIFRTTPEGKALTINPATARILGYDSRSALELIESMDNLAEQVYDDPADRQAILRLLREKGQAIVEVPFRRRDGSRIIVKLNIWMVQDENGNLRFIEGFIEDITERKLTEEKLKLYHRIFMASHDGIAVVDREGKITEMNPAQLKYMGEKCGVAIGQQASTGLEKADARKIMQSLEKTNHFKGEIKFPGRKDEFHYVDLSIFPIYNDDGDLNCYVGMGRDITEIKHVVNELAEANKNLRDTQSQLVQSEKMASLGMLVAGIAHEINTPMGSISSMHDTLMRANEKLSNILETECTEDSSNHRKIQGMLKVIDDANRVIKDGTERVTTIVRRLRSFARLDEAEMDKFDLHEGLEDTLTLIHHEIKHNITVNRHYGDIPRIYCSLSRLNQVFVNLLINAKQAIKGKGEIIITTYQRDNHVYLEFTDTGSGIPKDNLTKIFDPGFTTKGVGVGTGLGLSICYQILQDHHGEIKVQSEIGKGTTFTVILPTNLDEILGES